MHCDSSAQMSIRILGKLVVAGGLFVGIFLHSSAAFAATIHVRAGDNLQAAIDAAQPGDTLLLQAGATFSGNFLLPVKSGADFITIRTDSATTGLPDATSRIQPSHAGLLAKIKSPNNAAAIATVPGSHHWRLMLLEFPATRMGYGDIIQIGDGSGAQNTLAMVPHHIELDRLYIHGDPLVGQKRGIALNGASITIRNCHISDIKAVGVDAQAIGGWNGPGPVTVENNYIEASGENFLVGGADPGIANLVTSGIVVRHNYFSRPMSWKNPILATPSGVTAGVTTGGALAAGVYTYQVVARMTVGGGATARSTASTMVTATVPSQGGSVQVAWQAVPSAREYYVYGRSSGSMTQYWTVTGTTFTDTGSGGQSGNVPTTMGDRWLVKNLFQLKSARDVLVENNIFENNWAHGQPGYAILFTPRNQEGTCTWCVVENVTFQYNIVRNVASGLNILGWDDLAPSQQTKNIRVRHNLFYGLRTALGGSGWFLLMGDGPADIVIDHNTIDSNANAVLYVAGGDISAPRVVSGFQFTNNATRHGDYGINGMHFSFGNGIIEGYFPDGVVSGNWLQGGTSSRYPAGNYFAGTFEGAFVGSAQGNFTPSADSILIGRATDGGNIGADIAALTAGTRTVQQGSQSTAPRPSAPTNVRIVVR